MSKRKTADKQVSGLVEEEVQSPRRPENDKPLVFISHDSRDADLAEAFSNLLTDASGGVLRSFRSSDKKGTAGIEFGTEWYGAIMDKLNDATDVVALLTPQSVGRPWLLYEAGVAKGKVETDVLGVALGISLEEAGVGPFAQFHNCGDDEDSLTKLVLQLIRRNPEANPREEAVRRQVQAFRAGFATLMKSRPRIPQGPGRADENLVPKLFEEVKVMIQAMPAQLERILGRGPGRPGLRLSPSLVQRLILEPNRSGDRVLEAAGWEDLGGVFAQESPWLTSACFEVSHAVRTGEKERILAAKEKAYAAIRNSEGSLSRREDGGDDLRLFRFAIRHTMRLEVPGDAVLADKPSPGQVSLPDDGKEHKRPV